jgi:hypothetical protein
MADGTPDISRIIKLIMDNPKIIEEIGDMVKSESVDTHTEDQAPKTEEKVAEVAASPTDINPKSKNRKDLLYAMKPYLSEKRARAIDSMLTFAEVFTMLKR